MQNEDALVRNLRNRRLENLLQLPGFPQSWAELETLNANEIKELESKMLLTLARYTFRDMVVADPWKRFQLDNARKKWSEAKMREEYIKLRTLELGHPVQQQRKSDLCGFRGMCCCPDYDD